MPAIKYIDVRRARLARSLALFAASLLALEPLRAAAPGKLVFNRDIRPILSDNCLACHGVDAKNRKGNLRLDTAEGALAPNKDGRVAVRPGQPNESELWRRVITKDADDLMPPASSHKSLTEAQIGMLKRWIEQGAPYQKHWAFEAPTSPPVPEVRSASWPSTPVDRFILARLEREGLKPSREAEREVLIRRVAFDLTGLPPTPAEADAYLGDRKPGAYDRMVQRYLDSPRFGEHMGKHWLDVARYADTHGLHLDNERQMWAYRDWVVGAFNRNEPFDQFSIEQLAGDLLPNPTQDQLVATGFNRNNVTTGEGGAIDDEFIFRYTVERTATTVQTWMGLTAGCAVCHDHKFDPLSAKEFYSLYAFFHSAADPAMDGNALRTPPTLQLKSAEDERRLAELDEQVKAAEAKIGAALKSVAYTDPATLTPPPTARDEEVVWLEDDVPAGLKPVGTPNFASADQGRVFSGKRALRRQEGGITQDVFEASGSTLVIPQNARLFAHVFIDPANPPRLVMLQFNRDGWEHRALWGDADATDWGEKGKTSRAILGELPKAGEWVRLEFDAEKVGLKAGDKLKGIAYTQHGGLVYWDKAGVLGRVDPVNDPMRSLAAWMRQYDGKEAKELPGAVRKIFKDVAVTNRTPEQLAQLRDHYLAQVCAETRPVFDPLNGAVADLRKKREQVNDAIPTSFVWRDMDKPRESFVMTRGQYDKRGERVTRGVPAVFPPLANTNNPTRLDLARWLLAPENPLTARVTVNRFWQQFFGTGLVKSSDDFGTQGETPSHPELLDWLAIHFRESGWNVKELVKLMVTSATYRQASRIPPELLQKDPANRLLARGPRFRLDAEQLRDNALFVSGLMDGTMGGRGVNPYQPPNIWEPVGFVGSNTREYKQDMGSALYRRSLYVFFKRTAPPPFMSTFDAPNREQFCTRRERSNTPLQALQLLNDVQHFEAARALAQRMMQEGGSTPKDRIAYGWRLVLARRPSGAELKIALGAFEKHQERYRKDPEAAKQAVHFGDSKPAEALSEPELAAYTLAANLILNLDESLSRN
jgi:cytochrome c553